MAAEWLVDPARRVSWTERDSHSSDGYRARNDELEPGRFPSYEAGDIGDGWIHTSSTGTTFARELAIASGRCSLVQAMIAFSRKGTDRSASGVCAPASLSRVMHHIVDLARRRSRHSIDPVCVSLPDSSHVASSRLEGRANSRRDGAPTTSASRKATSGSRIATVDRTTRHRPHPRHAGRQDRAEPADERDAGGDGAGALQVVVRGLRPRPRQGRRPRPRPAPAHRRPLPGFLRGLGAGRDSEGVGGRDAWRHARTRLRRRRLEEDNRRYGSAFRCLARTGRSDGTPRQLVAEPGVICSDERENHRGVVDMGSNRFLRHRHVPFYVVPEAVICRSLYISLSAHCQTS